MTNVRYYSDIHTEFMRDRGKRFASLVDPAGMDVLVLAGDISVGRQIPEALGLLCTRVAPVPVLYVAGNHEFYGATLSETLAHLREAERRCSNLSVMDRKVEVIKGTRFLGASLWYEATAARVLAGGWSDFRLIRDLSLWVEESARAEIQFFQRNMRKGDVCLSHFLPSRACIHPRWLLSPTNCYFVTNMDHEIRARSPAVWIHGHTHETMDIHIESTRVVCNPYGYDGHETNPSFSFDATIEV